MGNPGANEKIILPPFFFLASASSVWQRLCANCWQELRDSERFRATGLKAVHGQLFEDVEELAHVAELLVAGIDQLFGGLARKREELAFKDFAE